MDRLLRKWETAKSLVPEPILYPLAETCHIGVIFFGTSTASTLEAIEYLEEESVHVEGLRLRALPFGDEVRRFIEDHEAVFLVEQNRDAQMRTLLVNELGLAPQQLHSILHYDGMPITARFIQRAILSVLACRDVEPVSDLAQGAR
jgi:2-oxoglutarate ferredoxin oxidoreductase subunit alpha